MPKQILHPLFDSSGIDDRLLDAVKNGRKVIALRDFKREGEVVKKGEKLVIGDRPGDHNLCVDHPLGNLGPAVSTIEKFEAQEKATRAAKYQRDVVAPKRQVYNVALKARNDAEKARADFQAKLNKATDQLQAADRRLKAAAAELQSVVEASPPAP